MKSPLKVLVVDDEPIVREALRDWLQDAGHEVLVADNGSRALEMIRQQEPRVAIVDLVMPGMDGIALLKQVKTVCPETEVIIITAYGTIPTAIAAVREGAYDYIEKPFCPEKAEILIAKLVERQRLIEENISLHHMLEERGQFENIVSRSGKMRQVVEVIRVVAKSNATVLITGPSGTGKELVARAIHAQSQRRSRPFVAVSCAALPESLLESELFGHEKGAFTGAHSQRRGKFEAAHRGTLFLDEIGEMSANIQLHMLRVLEEREFTRVGGNDLIKVDVRVISATNKDVKAAIADGQFREDLFYRLNVVSIDLPPLCERREDIPVLAHHFLKRFALENQKDVTDFAPDAVDFMMSYDWPGNVRELENAVERAVILSSDTCIQRCELPQDRPAAAPAAKQAQTLKDLEQQHIVSVLAQCNGNYSRAARVLGISRATLYNKMRAHQPA
jgi:DNA-binding NtrC family response regulator